MSLSLGCIADDYTGASDLANTLTRQGLRTIQTIGVPDPTMPLPAVDAVVIALKSRSIAPAASVAQSLAAARFLRSNGARHIMFKICSTFDSTDEGNIGPVTEALAAHLGAAIVPVTPAFPETGRTVFQGHLFVGAVPLDESPLKDHPLNPMRDANLVRVLARQSARPVGLVAQETVAAGEAAITARLAALAPNHGSAIIDAVSDHDLIALGAAAWKLPLSTGASGLGLGLARAALTTSNPTTPPPWPALPGPAAIIAGSCSAATRAQIAAIQNALPVRLLDIDRLLNDPDYHAETIAWATTHLPHRPILLASSAAPDSVAQRQATHGTTVGTQIETALADLAAALTTHGVRRLIVAGGETSGAIIDRLGIKALEIGPEIAPGVPLLRSLTIQPSLFALKSGNFGGPTFFHTALAAMAVTL